MERLCSKISAFSNEVVVPFFLLIIAIELPFCELYATLAALWFFCLRREIKNCGV